MPLANMNWYDPGPRKLEIVLGVQSPFEAAGAVAYLLSEAEPGFRPKSIDAQFAYVGGGFGGRDHTPFPLYVTLAAMFFPGHPVRLAHDRFQQFQAGIKRHAFNIRTQIGVNRETGKITAFAADHVLDGGGLMNYSISVAVVGATGALGIYDVPKVDVTTVSMHSRGVTAGSMRGYWRSSPPWRLRIRSRWWRSAIQGQALARPVHCAPPNSPGRARRPGRDIRAP